jgi:PIN domain nuclease of toxin-antitoxin system
MIYLVDTHVLLWYMEDNPRLSRKAVEEIESPQNAILLSKASLWEIAIKLSTGKLKLTMPLLELENYLERKSIIQLDFTFKDLDELTRLKFYHNDPFDRLIICQAITRNLTVISDDKKFKLYPVPLL